MKKNALISLMSKAIGILILLNYIPPYSELKMLLNSMEIYSIVIYILIKFSICFIVYRLFIRKQNILHRLVVKTEKDTTTSCEVTLQELVSTFFLVSSFCILIFKFIDSIMCIFRLLTDTDAKSYTTADIFELLTISVFPFSIFCIVFFTSYKLAKRVLKSIKSQEEISYHFSLSPLEIIKLCIVGITMVFLISEIPLFIGHISLLIKGNGFSKFSLYSYLGEYVFILLILIKFRSISNFICAMTLKTKEISASPE